MRATRAVALVLLLVAVAAASWWFFGRHTNEPSSVAVYYTKLDGTTLVPWTVSLGPARDRDAVRFPPGTTVLSAHVDGSTADVDLSKDVGVAVQGSFNEAAEFKALVYTLTALPGISSVRVSVAGQTLATLPGGHLELDEPLSRQSF
jgi:hypothetical protein